MTLSVCMIVKNEEEVLERALTCVRKFADEIVVCDTGSTDSSRHIAARFTDKVYFFSWCDDFSAARNFSFSKASGDLIMWLDADDFITDENCRKIEDIKREMADYDMAFLDYAAVFGEDGNPTFIYKRERIFKRCGNFRWVGAVHEVIEPRGKILYSDAVIYHKKQKTGDPLRNLMIYQRQIARGICLNEREKFYYGRELYYNGMYVEAAAVLKDFLKGDGWVENKIEACRTLYRIYFERDAEQSVSWLLKCFTYAAPRSEDCCLLGGKFLDEGDNSSAIFWYQRALDCPDERQSGAFVNLDYKAFIPYIQLCVAYSRTGDFKTACEYNELAGKIKPKDKSYLANKSYFKDKLK